MIPELVADLDGLLASPRTRGDDPAALDYGIEHGGFSPHPRG